MTDVERARDAGYDDLVDAIADDEGFYLACPNEHGWLPPRRICSACGARELTADPLPDAGEIVTFTEIGVGAPNFADDTPYVTAIADFGPVRVTGMYRGDADPEIGTMVGVEVGERETTGDRAVVLTPR